MSFSKKSFLALAIAATTGSPMVMASQAESQGFIEDSHLDFLTRNLYWHHDGHGGGADNREWGQGFRLDYTSGYTQGTVGFGVDLSTYALIKLDGGRGYSGRAGVLVPDGEGSRDEASSAGAAVKMRLSNTELKYGNNLRPYNPVFAPADARLVPSTATGFWLTSSELEGLALEAGHFTAAKDFNSTNNDDDFYAAYAGVSTDTVDFVGGNYTINDNLSVSLYGAEYKDIWRQYYANANYTYALTDEQSLNFDFNIYRSDDEGRKLAGEIDVTAWSFAAAYTIGAHTFKLTHQQIDGDQPFDYLGMGPGTYHDSIYLANSSQLVDFNGPNEKSWGLFYDLDFTSYGVPGLSFHARYIRGTDVDGSKMDQNSPYAYYADGEDHWERDLAVGYVVQSGSVKDLSVRLRQATHRIGNGKSDVSSDQVRLIVEYPLNIF
ncbi:outer membrane porin, OprD family [Pseudomonas daroniae]|uniref:Outer membrane porin, OprD family n=1 Tax=Phytopseudomonas daroniae TaxID=2487519 RepID=A0A4Q9QLW2_9GAMM|nr:MULTISPECIES: OprD family porin [Pseudomonas]TBU76144.1 outer membrane porin, OprD family [Pseudomonas daroniae]TBU80247.1 outer membrane porin, OprD family [Pseudomonas daroniae]TBU85323.1 outer membrane porin, OprD family [Pseudomonas sp. FRB 228]TBU94170.1 outer membrane porin, OprD family [Pseudomonas daroniae]